MSTPVKAREGRTWQCPPQGPPSPPGSRWCVWGAHPCPSSAPGTTREGLGSGRAEQRGQMEVVALLGSRRPRAEGRPPLRPQPSSSGASCREMFAKQITRAHRVGRLLLPAERPLSWAAWPSRALGHPELQQGPRVPPPALARIVQGLLAMAYLLITRGPPAGPWCLRPLSPKNGPRCAFPWTGPGLAPTPPAPALRPLPPGVRARLGCWGPVLRGS